MINEEDCDEVVAMVVSVAAYVSCVAVYHTECTAREPTSNRDVEKAQMVRPLSMEVNGHATSPLLRTAPESEMGTRETENQVREGEGYQIGIDIEDLAVADEIAVDIEDVADEDQIGVDIEDVADEDHSDAPDPEPMEPTTSSSISTRHDEPNRRKRKRLSGDPMVENLGSLAKGINRIASAMEERLRINKALDLSNLAGELKKIPDFSDELIIEASEYLASDEKLAKIFFILSEDQRKSWLLKRLGH
ncbi:hypothetical protein BVC80_887g16 [Macleaya cordata]|uniref:Uncharacterized protein n=1 Tax=Macleaya cordata TaxID=56857 RepID=A0A200RDG2_MACCD|nr:hypothetical protein BVC80_887g16 [Macleaya cordata]